MKINFFQKKSSGMTLTEMLVAISVSTLLTMVISTTVTRTFMVNRYTFEQGLNNATLENSTRNFVRYLREARQSDEGGYLIESADDFELVFFADVDEEVGVERVRYFLEDHKLKMGVAFPRGNPVEYPIADDEVKIIGNGIMNTADQPIFYYYTKEYPLEAEGNPISTPVLPNEIGLIKLDIYANINPEKAPNNMRMETFVRPRNIK